MDADTWPNESLKYQTYWLSRNGLADVPNNGTMSICSPQSMGMLSGDYMPLSNDPTLAQMPGDQRSEDAGSLCFDGAPLIEPLDIVGTSKIDFDVSSDAASGLLAVRLCDVDENLRFFFFHSQKILKSFCFWVQFITGHVTFKNCCK